MTNETLYRHIREAYRLNVEIKKLKKAMEAHTDKIKAEMERQAVETIEHGERIATYKKAYRSSIDGKALKMDYPEIAEQYTSQTEYSKLSIR